MVRALHIPPLNMRSQACLLKLLGALFLCLPGLAEEVRGNPERFLRFVDEPPGRGRLETALCIYSRPDGVEVTLVGAVHFADLAYYKKLGDVFLGYEAVLYELIDWPSVEEWPESAFLRKHSWLLVRDVADSLAQHGLCAGFLGLAFQLDEVDLTRPNFVHADLDLTAYYRLLAEKSTLQPTPLAQFARMWPDLLLDAPRLFGDLLVTALAPDRRSGVKRILARLMVEEMRTLDLPSGSSAEMSVIIEDRDRRALEVLKTEIAAGKRRLAIFYGAAHMPDLERRLEAELDFQLTGVSWLTAWSLAPDEPLEEAVSLISKGQDYREAGRPARAALRQARAIRILEKLVEKEGRAELADLLATTLTERAVSLDAMERHDDAMISHDRAVLLLEKAAQAGGTDVPGALAQSLKARADSLVQQDEPYGALEDYRAVERILGDLTRRPEGHDFLNILAQARTGRGYILSRQGETKLALAAHTGAVEVYGQLVEQEGMDAFTPHLAHALTNRAGALLTLQRYQDALGDSEQAVRILEGSPHAQHIAVSRLYRGVAHINLGRPSEAIPDLEKAIASFEASLKEDTTEGVESWADSARGYLADAQAQTEKYELSLTFARVSGLVVLGALFLAYTSRPRK